MDTIGSVVPDGHEKDRHKRHRPVAPDLAGLSPKEIAEEARSYPVSTLAAALNSALEEVWHKPDELESIARRFAPKDGRGRRAVVHLLSIAAAAPTSQLGKANAINASGRAVHVSEPLTDGDRQRWLRTDGFHQVRWELQRFSEALCLRDGCPQKGISRQRLWCAPHTPVLPDVERRAVHRRMQALLNAAAHALDV